MKNLVDQLRKARRLVALDWAEPFCVDAGGRICSPDDEGVSRFSLRGALEAAGPDSVQLFDLMEQIACPMVAAFMGALDHAQVNNRKADWTLAVWLSNDARSVVLLQDWLEEPSRKISDVLRLLDRAILRAASGAVRASTWSEPRTDGEQTHG